MSHTRFREAVNQHDTYRHAMRGDTPMSRQQRAFPTVRVTLFAILLLFALGYGRAHAQDRDYSDPAWAGHHPLPALEYVFDAAALADMLTTLDIKHHPDLQEADPLMPRHPSDRYIVTFMLVGVGLHALVTHAMLANAVSSGWVRAWEYVSIGAEVGGAARNYSLGLRFAL